MKINSKNAIGGNGFKPNVKYGRLIIIFTSLSFIVGLQAATQYFAYTFNYHISLGNQINYIYPPWSILEWSWQWYSYYPDQITTAGIIGVVVSTIGFLLTFLLKTVISNTARAEQFIHGSARWAEKKDIEAAGLFSNDVEESVCVGGWMDKKGNVHYLRHSGAEHVLCYAPTRSGKGVGLVIPTLLSWSRSAVITDLKGELWALTAGWRKKSFRNKVLRFEPASATKSIHWNPLDEIRLGTEFEVADVQNLVQIIVDPEGKGLNDHWTKTAFALLVGVILHSLYKGKNDGISTTLSSIDEMLSDPSRNIKTLWNEMIVYPHRDGKNHPAVGAAGRDMLDRPVEEAGSVLSTVKSFLSLYRDPIVANNTKESQFCIKDLMNHVDPVSLYIITQPNDKARLRPLVRIMITMIVRLLADKMDFQNGLPIAHYKHRLLMMLDEFPSLGKLEILQESLAFVAGYGIKCYLICQDINQLKSRETGYGQDETITSNCHIQNACPPNRIETAEHLSRLTGQTTVVKEQITTSGHRVSPVLGHVSRTFQEVQRPLLTPDECLRIPGPKKSPTGEIKTAGDMVVYVSGYPAIYGKQVLYFQEKEFLKRSSTPAPQTTDIIRETVVERRIKLS